MNELTDDKYNYKPCILPYTFSSPLTVKIFGEISDEIGSYEGMEYRRLKISRQSVNLFFDDTIKRIYIPQLINKLNSLGYGVSILEPSSINDDVVTFENLDVELICLANIPTGISESGLDVIFQQILKSLVNPFDEDLYEQLYDLIGSRFGVNPFTDNPFVFLSY